jgi:hypothetical protein
MRNLLLEMAVYSENDVLKMNPVASVSTKVTDELEGNELRKYVLQNFQSVEIQANYKIDEHIVGELISHHCGHRQKKKAALLALPYVINANLVTAPWRRRLGDDGQPVRKNDKRPSGMISAPILIDGIKCLCSLTLRKSKGIITPYSLVLKDENGEIIEGEKMEGTISSVPHSSSKPTAIGDAHSFKATTSHDTNPSFQSAKVEQNIETTKDNNIKTENYTYMNKKQIRLTESDLKQIVKESVNKILNEAYGTMPKDDIKRVANLDAASQSRFDERGEESEDIKNDEFSRRLQNLQRDLTKCWWMANSLGSHMKHNEFLGKASERYANYVMDNISNASDGLDRIIAIAKMKIGQ